MVLDWFFMVPGGFSWFFMVPGWFLWVFMVPGLFFMVLSRFSGSFMVPGWFSCLLLPAAGRLCPSDDDDSVEKERSDQGADALQPLPHYAP